MWFFSVVVPVVVNPKMKLQFCGGFVEPISGDTGDGYWVYHGLPYIAWHQDVARGVESAKIMDGMEMDGRVVALDDYVDLFSFMFLVCSQKKSGLIQCNFYIVRIDTFLVTPARAYLPFCNWYRKKRGS